MKKEEVTLKYIKKTYRTNGELIYKKCGKNYYSHPLYYNVLDFNGDPFLNMLCNGDLVKL
jgi:hypothetical protein